MTGHGSKFSKKVIIDKPGEEFLSIAWWNGGGAVKKRLEVNPGIRKFITVKFMLNTPPPWHFRTPLN